MSAIGDYIHYYTSNYIYSGTQSRSTRYVSRLTRAQDALTIFSNHHQKLMAKYNLQYENQLLSPAEKTLFKLLLTSLKNPVDSASRFQRQILDQVTRDYFNLSVEGLHQRFNQETLGARTLADSVHAVNNAKSNLSRSGAGKGQKIDVPRFNAKLNEALTKIQIVGLTNREEIQRGLTEIQALFQERYSNFGQYAKNQSTSDLIPKWLSIEDLAMYSNQKGENLITQFNKLLNLSAVTSGQIGDVFELMVAAAPILRSEQAYSNINDIITDVQKNMKGKVSSTTTFYQKDFMSGIKLSDILPESYSKQFDGGILTSMSHSGASGKIDVQFDWFGKEWNISAKNYNLRNPQTRVGLVDNTPLLTLLYYQDNPELVNHYLNIVAATNLSAARTNWHEQEGVSQAAWIDGNIVHAAHTIMREIILLAALAGSRDKKVNLLVVNDNSRGGDIYIYNLFEIYNYLTTGDNYRRGVLITPIEFLTDHFHITQHWYGSAGHNKEDRLRRITQLLARVHQTKISVSLTPGAIKGTL